MKRFSVLNIGNTHTQIMYGIAGETVQQTQCRTYKTSEIPFGEFSDDIITIYSSVVPQITAEIKKYLPDAIACIAENVPFIDFSDAPPTLGMDRIANCAALTRMSNDGIIIDAGTAITLEVVKNRKFIGGAILPGTTILAKAMHDYTGALPLVECSTAPDLNNVQPQFLTVEAMKTGIQSAAVYGTLHLMSNFLQQLNENSPVYVCGGNRQSILNQTTNIKLIDGGEDFTLQGLIAIAKYHITI